MSSRIHTIREDISVLLARRSYSQALLVATTESRDLPSLLLSPRTVFPHPLYYVPTPLLRPHPLYYAYAYYTTKYLPKEEKAHRAVFSTVVRFQQSQFLPPRRMENDLTFHPSRNSFLPNSEPCPTDMTDSNETRHTGRTFVAKPVSLCCDSNIVTNTTIHHQNPSSLFTRSRFF